MKTKYIFFLTLLYHSLFFAQVGINTSDPKSTLEVSPNSNSTSVGTGVIIPRVTSLNTTNTKEIGLLVFLNSTDTDKRGFYWWDGSNWNPFQSINKIKGNQSVTYASTKKEFKEGYMSELASSDNKTLEFNALKTSNPNNFEINTNGELVVKNKGYYHIQASSFLYKNAGNGDKRDQLDMKIFINGVDASVENSQNFNIEGSKSFPIGFFSIAINAAGTIKLNSNDRISMKIIRTYRDTNPSGTLAIIPDQSAASNIVLRFLGDF